MQLELEHVTRRFGARSALDDVSLTVTAGEVVGLAGPNGAGKTTMLRLAMGFLEPQRGRVRVFGHDARRRRHLGEVGWMPEHPSFPPGYTVAQVVRFQAATFPSWDAALAAALLDRLALDPTQQAKRLSRGGAGRLALVLALAHRPRLLLLDDPCLGLDPGGRRLLLGELLAAAAEEGCGVLLSTHLLAEVEPALDRLLVLDAGRLVLDQRVEELRSRGLAETGAPARTLAARGAETLEDLFVELTAASGHR